MRGGAALRRHHGKMAGLVQQVAGKAQLLRVEHQAAVLDHNAGEDRRLGDRAGPRGKPDLVQERDDAIRQRIR